MTRKVGFIGLGAMGRPMAENLLAAGFPLAVWARRRLSAQPLLDLGADWRDTPRELAAAVDALFVCVTTGADVASVLLGADGVAAGARSELVVVDHSTIAPDDARRFAALLAERGADYLDAPVSGGGVGARAATLAIMAGGDTGALERVRPMLAKLGKTIVHVGPSGAGQVAKLCNQMIMVAAIEACAEAARLAAAHGVDFGVVRTAMMAGSAGSRVLDVFGGRMAARDFAAGVEARLHHKDYAIVLDAAARAGVPLPVAATVAQQLNALMARGWGGQDTAVLLRVLEGDSMGAPESVVR